MPKTIGSEAIAKPLTPSKLSKKGLCDYVVNVATGCLHGCTFCYVPSTPAVRMRQQVLRDRGVSDPQLGWGDYLFVREDAPDALERQLAGMKVWHHTPAGKGVVMLCSTTDPYQNSRVAAVTRECVKVLLKYGKRVRILTRSPLWVQDIDILRHPNVTVGMSIPHLDDGLSRAVEPYAPLPSDRLKAMQIAQREGVRRFVAMAPTPGFRDLDRVRAIADVLVALDPEVVFWEPINARGSNRGRMRGSAAQFPPSDAIAWREWFEFQADLVWAGFPDGWGRLHLWPDAGIESMDGWFYRPSVERWLGDDLEVAS